VRPTHQRRILFWGILTAVFLRVALIFLGAAIVREFHWVLYIFGLFLLYTAYKLLRTRVTASWWTSAAMGPEPLVALMDAIRRDDEGQVDAIWEDVHSVPPMIPAGEFSHFAEYNAQIEKARFNAAGYVKCGPSRAPYRDLPESWRRQAEVHGKGWAELRRKYARAASDP
jgi:hypothetical protein